MLCYVIEGEGRRTVFDVLFLKLWAPFIGSRELELRLGFLVTMYGSYLQIFSHWIRNDLSNGFLLYSYGVYWSILKNVSVGTHAYVHKINMENDQLK